MNPISLDINGSRVTLRSIERNKTYKCKCENPPTGCQLKQKLSLLPSSEYLVATEAVFNVRNTASETWPISTSGWELVDTDGYAYRARSLCDDTRPARTIDPDFHPEVSPGTQVDFVLVFPELAQNTDVACISYRKRDESYTAKIRGSKRRPQRLEHADFRPESYSFEIRGSKRRARDLVQTRERLRSEIRAADEETPKMYLAELEKTIQSKLGKSLTGREAESQGRQIERLAHRLSQTLELMRPAERAQLETAFQAAMTSYEEALESDKKRAGERKKGTQTIEGLRRLTPSEFEEWVSELFEDMGYRKVTLRGRSGDQGADIFVEKDGDRVAVQCKRYKNKVGAPEVQTLLGAMHSTESQRGFLVTTAMFSLPAEKMARDTAIELIDGNTLIEWYATARAK